MWPSPREVIEYGDIESAAIDILLTSSLQERFDTEISTDLTGITDTAETRWLAVSREGGPQKFPIDYPRIDINSYSQKRDVAYDIASAARAVLFAASGYRGHGLVILAAQEEVGLVRSTDSRLPNLFRYFCSLRFTCRADSSTES